MFVPTSSSPPHESGFARVPAGSNRPLARACGRFPVAVLTIALVLALGASADRLPLGNGYRLPVTHRRIERVTDSLYRYFEDVQAWPTSLASLHTRPVGATRWFGSYLSIRYASSGDRRDRNLRDGWGRSLVFHALGAWDSVVYSLGPNGADDGGLGDDIASHLNGDEILWRRTKRELRVLNTMVACYDRNNPSHHLPNSFEGSHNQLLGDGYLPGLRPAWKRDYWTDGWLTKYSYDKHHTPPMFSNGRP